MQGEDPEVRVAQVVEDRVVLLVERDSLLEAPDRRRLRRHFTRLPKLLAGFHLGRHKSIRPKGESSDN